MIVISIVTPTCLLFSTFFIDDVARVSTLILASPSPTGLRSTVDSMPSRAGLRSRSSGGLLLVLNGCCRHHCFDLIDHGTELGILDYHGLHCVHQCLSSDEVLLRGGEDSVFVEPHLQDVVLNLTSFGLKLSVARNFLGCLLLQALVFCFVFLSLELVVLPAPQL